MSFIIDCEFENVSVDITGVNRFNDVLLSESLKRSNFDTWDGDLR